jgi:hypothetical protein
VLNFLSAFSLSFHGFEMVVVVLEMVVFIYISIKISHGFVMMVLVLVVEISSLLFCFFSCDDGSCCVMAVCVTY